jgi:hypothetical protein
MCCCLGSSIDQAVQCSSQLVLCTDPSEIVKVATRPRLQRVASISLSTGEWSPIAAVIDSRAGFAYFAFGNLNAKVVKISIGDKFSRVETASLDNSGIVSSIGRSSAVIDPKTGYAYFGVNGGADGASVSMLAIASTAAGAE